MKIPLSRIAHGRSGDKGDTANVGIIAFDERHYPILVREVTADRAKAHFGDYVQGNVERYELPNLGALNFLLHGHLAAVGHCRFAPTRKARRTARRSCAWRSK